MYFVTYTYCQKESIGILNEDKSYIIPIKMLYAEMGKEAPQTMLELINNFSNEIIGDMKSIINAMNSDSIPLKDVKLKSPIPNPLRNVFCLGKNYSEHVKELGGLPGSSAGVPEEPIFFTKATSSVIGPEDTINSHSDMTSQLDYEVELAVVIGKSGINIKKEDVKNYIFGYTIANDITARDIQKKRNQWFKGKSLDTFCPMGPYLIHKSKVPFPVELNISSRVNGELRQSSNTKNMIFDISNAISDLSKGMMLRPGDIILTGTPSGVGMGFKPPKFLKAGDIVECEVENIGVLRNIVE